MGCVQPGGYRKKTLFKEHGSCRCRSVNWTCWHLPARDILPCSLLPNPSHDSGNTSLYQPLLHCSPPWQEPQQLCFVFPSSKPVHVPVCVLHQTLYLILSSLQGLESCVWETPCPAASAGAGPCLHWGHSVPSKQHFSPALPVVGTRQHRVS